MRINSVLLAVIGIGGSVSLALQGCKSQEMEQPKAPEETYLYTDMQIQNEKHLSVVNLPLEVPISELEKQLNGQLNGLIYEDNSYENFDQDNLKAKVWKLSPIKVQALDSTFLFEVPLKVWVSAGYKVSPLGITMSGYKDTEFALRIRFISKINVAPDWRILTHTTVDSYDWITEPSIKVAGISIPIKSMMSRMMNRNFESITHAIDEQVEQTIELKKYVTQVWDLARRPVLLSKEYNTWLALVPTAVVMTPLLVRGNTMRTSLGIRGYTQTVTSPEKPAIKGDSKVPNLFIEKKIAEDFRIALISVIPYQEASRLAGAEFVGEKFTFKNSSYSVEVTSLEMFGQNDLLVIKAGLKGSLNGIIYLKGTPFYDPITKNLFLKNLDYDLDSRNLLLKSASWLLQGKFSKLMEQQLVFPIGDQITAAHATIQSTLSNNTLSRGVVLNGTLKEIVPDRVYLTPQHIYSVVFATGRVSLRVQGRI